METKEILQADARAVEIGQIALDLLEQAEGERELAPQDEESILEAVKSRIGKAFDQVNAIARAIVWLRARIERYKAQAEAWRRAARQAEKAKDFFERLGAKGLYWLMDSGYIPAPKLGIRDEMNTSGLSIGVREEVGYRLEDNTARPLPVEVLRIEYRGLGRDLHEMIQLAIFEALRERAELADPATPDPEILADQLAAAVVDRIAEQSRVEVSQSAVKDYLSEQGGVLPEGIIGSPKPPRMTVRVGGTGLLKEGEDD